jgi:starch synthase
MKILFIAAEAAPVVKVGGLADVVTSLSLELIKKGHDVRIMIPKYSVTDFSNVSFNNISSGFTVTQRQENYHVNVLQSFIKSDLPIYFMENAEHFEDGEVYGEDELNKFLFFSRAVIHILNELDWRPDIVHCHDWHTSLISMFIRKFQLPFNTVLTIHNLFHQGSFDDGFLHNQELAEYWDYYPLGISGIPYNFLAQGILNSDLITTVSKNYAREILIPGNGEGLEEVLQFRRDGITGIINGIDCEIYNPKTDGYLASNYSYDKLDARIDNKRALIKKLGPGYSADIPLIGFIQRLDEQKGIDILIGALDNILNDVDVQFVILGKGKQEYEDYLKTLSRKYPGKLSVNIGFDNGLAHLIYAGCDMHLIPSLFEPCGLGQMIAMHYGSIPVVRHTGGLVDTVPPFNKNMTTGSGFVFYQYSVESLVKVLKLALEKTSYKTIWNNAVKRLMAVDFSWSIPAEEYQNLYLTLSNNR